MLTIFLIQYHLRIEIPYWSPLPIDQSLTTMNTSTTYFSLRILGIALLTVTLASCGGSSATTSTDTTDQSSNQAPTARVASQADVLSGANVSLNGSTSSDPDGDTLNYTWRQLLGTHVTLQNSSSASASFVAPTLPTQETFSFRLTVSDSEFSDSAEVSFQISPASDTTAPSVVSRSPEPSQTDVAVSSEINVTFDEALAPSSVDASSLTLNEGSSAVTGSVSYDENTQSIRFVPDTELTASTTYTVTLGTSAEDLAGNQVQADSWNFSTRASSPPPSSSIILEGYGTSSDFGGGSGHETCTVSNLNDSGSGSLRDCVVNRNGSTASPVPRKVVFTVGGTITLTSDLFLRQPFITIDGLTAPSPGITIAKTGDGTNGEFRVNTWPAQGTCAHDVLIQGVRFIGVWDASSEAHSQNANTLGIDGEDFTSCINNIVFNRITISNAQDTAGDIWGSATNITFQYSAFINSLHPQSHSHSPGGVAGQERRYISIHHNLYAYNHERQTNIRGNTWDYNFEQNILHAWGPFGFGGGYATQFRCRNGGCPQRINLLDNYYTSSPATPTNKYSYAIVFDDGASSDEVYSNGNRFPSQESDRGTATSEFTRSSVADITRYPLNELTTKVLPNIGAPYRTAEEDLLFTEVAGQIESE
jgi:pectate lyase